jgi:hypothetical protein
VKNWKTTMAGIGAGLLMLLGPSATARLNGDTSAPPITMERVLTAAGLAAIGVLAKDADVTGIGAMARRKK